VYRVRFRLLLGFTLFATMLVIHDLPGALPAGVDVDGVPETFPVTVAAPADTTESDTLRIVKPPPPTLDSLLLHTPRGELLPLDSLLLYHAAANWFDLSPWVPGLQTVGSGYTGHPLYLANGGLPAFLLPVRRDGLPLNNPATGLYNLNMSGFSRGAAVQSGPGLTLVTALPPLDSVLTDLDYRQAFYGNNRVLFRTQHPLPQGLFRGETRQQFFSGKMENGKARDNCTSLALYRYLGWRSWLVSELNLERHRNGVWYSTAATLQRETRQEFSLLLPGAAGRWRWQPACRYQRYHLYQESPYNAGLETKRWLGSFQLRRSFTPVSHLDIETELDATEVLAESYQLNRRLWRTRLQLELVPWRALRLLTGGETLWEDERDRWLRSVWLDLRLRLHEKWQWRLELAAYQAWLPFSWQRGGAEVPAQYETIYPALRQGDITQFVPDPDAVSCSRWGGGSSLRYTHPAGHLLTLTGWGWDFADFPYLYTDADTARVMQRPSAIFGQELQLEIALPGPWRWLLVQSAQSDSEGLVNTELPTFRLASECRWSDHFFDRQLRFHASVGLTTTWGAVRSNGEPLSDQALPYLHLVARRGNFTLYWALHNPFSFQHYAQQEIPGMHHDEILGVMWRLVN